MHRGIAKKGERKHQGSREAVVTKLFCKLGIRHSRLRESGFLVRLMQGRKMGTARNATWNVLEMDYGMQNSQNTIFQTWQFEDVWPLTCCMLARKFWDLKKLPSLKKQCFNINISITKSMCLYLLPSSGYLAFCSPNHPRLPKITEKKGGDGDAN